MSARARRWRAGLAAAGAVVLAVVTLQFYGSSVMQRALARLGAFCGG